MKKLKFTPAKIMLGLVVLFISLFLLAACGNDAPVDRVAEIDRALKATGYTPLPTINPTIKAKEALGFSIVIFGIRDYYPDRPGEKVTVNLLNERETSVYMSQICQFILQRAIGDPKANQWEDIAYNRPCPPNDTRTFRLNPGTAIDTSLEFDKTRPLQGKSWYVPGTYRLLLTYYLRCPDAYNTISYCEDRYSAQSDWFQIKIDPGITPSLPGKTAP